MVLRLGSSSEKGLLRGGAGKSVLLRCFLSPSCAVLSGRSVDNGVSVYDCCVGTLQVGWLAHFHVDVDLALEASKESVQDDLVRVVIVEGHRGLVAKDSLVEDLNILFHQANLSHFLEVLDLLFTGSVKTVRGVLAFELVPRHCLVPCDSCGICEGPEPQLCFAVQVELGCESLVGISGKLSSGLAGAGSVPGGGAAPGVACAAAAEAVLAAA
eukprot:115303-Rhodomonas_salina.1